MNIVEYYHNLIFSMKNKNTAIDATCGNGHDTLFLQKIFNKVIAIDIQDLAIKRTKEKTSHFQNVTVIKDDFNNLDKYPNSDLIVFNLGFLPGSNKKVKTQDYTSNEAILKAYNICNELLIVACYVKHDGGMDEYNHLISTLISNHISYELIDSFESTDKLIIIKK